MIALDISKVIILNDIIKERKWFLKRVQKFNSNVDRKKRNPDKLDNETKLEIHEDGKWKEGTTRMMGDSTLSGLR